MASLLPEGSRVHAVGAAPDEPLVSVPLAGIMDSMQRNAPDPICVSGTQKSLRADRLHTHAEAALRRWLSVVVTFVPEAA